MGAFIVAIAFLILILILCLWQRQWGIGTIALGVAFLALLTGSLDVSDVVAAWEILGHPLITIISLLIIAEALDEAGFFRLTAPLIIFLGFGRGRWLFFLTVLLSGAIATLLTNYGSILFWTPIVIEALRGIRFRPQVTLAYVFATGLMANVASLALPISNPLNGIIIDFFKIPTWRYFLVIIPLYFVIILLCIGVLWFYFDLCLPKDYSWEKKRRKVKGIRDILLCRWGFPILGILLLNFALAQPPSIMVFITALFTLSIAGRWYNLYSTPTLSTMKVIRRVPWQLIGFTIGMYLVGISIGKTGLIYFLSQFYSELSGWGISLAAMGTGFLATLSSGIMNNFPTVVNGAIALSEAQINDSAIYEAMVYSHLIGCTLGAKISPIGSLATLLWLDIVHRKILRLTWQQYFKIYIALILPILFLTLLFLVLWLPWLVA